jgi:hypothetical protein
MVALSVAGVILTAAGVGLAAWQLLEMRRQNGAPRRRRGARGRRAR